MSVKLRMQNILMWCSSEFYYLLLERNIRYYDMQNISSKNSLNKGTNVKIFCSSKQCQIANEELINLCQQVSSLPNYWVTLRWYLINDSITYNWKVTDLKETITSLENIIQLKDVQLQNMQRDNNRLSAELKKQQRYIRNLKRKLFRNFVQVHCDS